jgi:hypothetical protein
LPSYSAAAGDWHDGSVSESEWTASAGELEPLSPDGEAGGPAALVQPGPSVSLRVATLVVATVAMVLLVVIAWELHQQTGIVRQQGCVVAAEARAISQTGAGTQVQVERAVGRCLHDRALENATG